MNEIVMRFDGIIRPLKSIPQASAENRKIKVVKELFRDAKWFAIALYAFAFIREGGEA